MDALVFELGLPVLGICYGQQTMCMQLGGQVEKSDHQEYGRAYVEVGEACALTQDVWSPGAREQVWMSHGDRVAALPDGFRIVATSEGAPFAMVADDSRHFYGIQFHPESVLTEGGHALFANFLGLARAWRQRPEGRRDAVA